MTILAVIGLKKHFGAERILAGVNLEIEAGQKMALVGRNGCGKTTLLRIIAGEQEPDHGSVHIQREVRIGFLAQEYRVEDGHRSLWAEMEAVSADLTAIEAELALAAQAMAAVSPPPAAVMDRYARLQEQFERRGGYTIRARTEKVLRGVGFADGDWGKPMGVLSGGELTRAGLAGLLLRQPDLLLLDEPTNHLDLWAMAWLEEYLISYAGAVLVVSHDRYFLDRVVGGVYELAAGVTRFYRGNYTVYRMARAAEERLCAQARLVQEKEIARKERLVRESAADERSKRQARSIGKSLVRLKPIEQLPKEEPAPRLELNALERSGRIVLTVEGLTKRFGDTAVLKEAGFRLEAGEKVGVIGANGAGKTTLLRLLLGLIPPDAGQIQLGHNVRTGYFAQEEIWTGGGTVFSVIQEAGAGNNLATRNHLAQLLFRGDDVWKNVADLSGGEARRLALARLILSGANLLLFDEPTNHLDLTFIEALEEALASYPGTVLAVSHDRYFLGRVTQRLLALAEGRLQPFSSYEAFAVWHGEEQERLAAIRGKTVAARREQQRREREIRQAPLREERRRAKAMAGLEADLAAKEEERARLVAEIARPEIAADFLVLNELSTRLAGLELEIAKLYDEWGVLMDES